MKSNRTGKKLFLVYKITNLLNSKIYVGAHGTTNIDDGYMGSSKPLTKDIIEFGEENFRKEILFAFSNWKDMMMMEGAIVNKNFCHRTDTYNQMVGGSFNMSWVDLIYVRDKDNNASIVYKDDPRFISGELVYYFKGLKRPTEWWVGRKHTEITKNKMSRKATIRQIGNGNTMYGKKHSQESREKISASLSKEFFVYDQNGIFVERSLCIKTYAEEHGMLATKISKVINGKQKHHCGYRFFGKFMGHNVMWGEATDSDL